MIIDKYVVLRYYEDHTVTVALRKTLDDVFLELQDLNKIGQLPDRYVVQFKDETVLEMTLSRARGLRLGAPGVVPYSEPL